MTIIVVCLSLLMSYILIATAITALTVLTAEHFCLVVGLFLGSSITLLFSLYFKRYYRRKYQQISHTLTKEQQYCQVLLEEKVQDRTIELNIALQELANANQELERMSVHDELTGLHNRRFYDEKMVAEYRRSRRNLTALSFVLIDIDHFKSVNDNYGHVAGDQCLIWLAKLIKQFIKRTADKAFRYGGEEFCLILPNTDSKGALLLTEQLRLAVSQQAFTFNNAEILLTISSGIFTYQQQVDVGPEQIFIGADKALYQAKDNGRNQTKQYAFNE